jgi:predicted RNase H-like HicB family nuclease
MHAMKDIGLTAVYVKGEYGYTAYIQELGGVITQGKTITEAEENLYEALQLFLETETVSNSVDSINSIKKPFLSLTKVL